MSREQFGTQVAASVQQRARATVRGLQRQGRDITLASFVEQALARQCDAMERDYNDGKPWPTGEGVHLPPGPRIQA